MKVLAVIPARGGSKRIPRKNIIDFNGQPLISYPLTAAQESGIFDKIHVSTDDLEIKSVVESLGWPIDFLRDAKLADDYTGVLDVLRWVLRKYQEMGEVFEVVCLLYATAALIDSSDLRQGFKAFIEDPGHHNLLAVTEFGSPIQRAMFVDNQGLLAPVDLESYYSRSQDLEARYADSATFAFFYSRDLLGINDVGVVNLHCKPFLLPRYKGVDIDTKEDLRIAELIYKALNQ